MKFGTRDLLIATACLAGYIAFLRLMMVGDFDRLPTWVQALSVLLPIPLVGWLGHINHRQKLGKRLLMLETRGSWKSPLFTASLILGLACSMVFGASIVVFFGLLISPYLCWNWNQCEFREKGVVFLGYLIAWENKPVQVLEMGPPPQMCFRTLGFMRWAIQHPILGPPESLQEALAILEEKQGPTPPADEPQPQ